MVFCRPTWRVVSRFRHSFPWVWRLWGLRCDEACFWCFWPDLHIAASRASRQNCHPQATRRKSSASLCCRLKTPVTYKGWEKRGGVEVYHCAIQWNPAIAHFPGLANYMFAGLHHFGLVRKCNYLSDKSLFNSFLSHHNCPFSPLSICYWLLFPCYNKCMNRNHYHYYYSSGQTGSGNYFCHRGSCLLHTKHTVFFS